MNNPSAPETPGEEQKVEAYYRDVGALRPRPSPESPAKEQPGEQNVQENECRPSSESGASTHEAVAATESAGYLSQRSVVQPVPPDGIGSLAPDVAAMVRRLVDRGTV